MKRKRINSPVILMVMAIIAIIAFQGYWMYKNYQEEEKTLQIRTSAIFRNVAYKLQSESWSGDTTIKVWARTRAGITAPGGSIGATQATRAIQGIDTVTGTEFTDAPRMYPAPEPPLYPAGRVFMKTTSSRHRDTSLREGAMLSLDSMRPERIRSIFVQKGMKAGRSGKISNDSTISISIRSDDNMMFSSARPLNGTVKAITVGVPSKLARSTQGGKPGRMTARIRNTDTLTEYLLLSRIMEDGSFQELLQRVDSLKDTISMKELDTRFRTALDKEAMKVKFDISKDSLSQYPEGEFFDVTRTNEVPMGYARTYYLRYDLPDSFQYIIRKLSPQITLSLLLIALTSFSFVLLYRNLVKQRRLAQFKNDLISNITHELKTPIATVSVAIEALKNFHAMDDPRRTEEYLDISTSELQRLSLLVDKVLRLSMFEKHQVELKTETFDLRKLAEEVMSSMRLQFERSKANVVLHAEGEDLTIQADRLHITSVIFNLLDNALKYGKDKQTITVSIERNAEGLQLSVADNGIGIPAAYQKKIFDKFFRVPSGDTHNVKGYGLGLSYVAYVVEKHKGKIEVVSEPGEGSSFIIQLPGTA